MLSFHRSPKFVLIVALLLTLAFTSVVMADGRINAVHHFGGDAIFCQTGQGCWLTNANGVALWTVSQAAIDAAIAEAEANRQLEVLVAEGQGTYGPVRLTITAYLGLGTHLHFFGYDEWGKINAMEFGPDYTPVTNPPEIESSHKSDGVCPSGFEIGDKVSIISLGGKTGTITAFAPFPNVFGDYEVLLTIDDTGGFIYTYLSDIKHVCD